MKKSVFQFALIFVLIFAIILAVLIFSGVIKTPGSKNTTAGLSGTVVIWGTLPEEKMLTIIDPIVKDAKTYKIEYVQKKESSYESDLVEALASNKGPDIIVLDPGLLIKQSDKIAITSYKTFTERDYKDTFASIGDLFLSPDGILAIPISIDPIVLYYNKDILEQEGVALPPQYWNDLISLAPNLSKVSPEGILTKNMVALGEYDNVEHAKEIFSMMVLQLGNPIVESQVKYRDKVPYLVYKSVLNTTNSDGIPVGESALRFYTQFSDPAKQTYSWNKSYNNSKSLFIGGKLAFYFGYASEFTEIQEKNPNLRFDIARVPQIRADYPTKATYGKLLGVAVLKSSKNIDAAFNATQYLMSADFAPFIANALGTAPARRDLLSEKKEDAYNGVVYPSAIIAKSWLDPDATKTGDIFKRMITGVVSGRSTLSESVQDFVNSMNDVLP
jgi:ABC-type glycerol-3-phosphate transport system substrate-binding protein